MSVNWTKEQQQVIESRGSNLLVSAAAGSGKTAVLVERIIRMVTDEAHPVDIDRLLVMTFTNAAAAEMRERIGAAIEQKLNETPENEHLQMQAALVHHAQITTIDSFCLNLIRNHFNRLELDPSFQIGDEGELTLLRGDVMKELLEDYYEQGGERFERFVETYAQGKSDAGIEDYIMQVYQFSQSNPDPERWLRSCRAELAMEETGDLEHTAWMTYLKEDLRRQVGELASQMREALEISRSDEYFIAYEPMFASDLKKLEALGQAETFGELTARLSSLSWDRLAAVRKKEADPEVKAYLTGIRDQVKKAAGKLRELYAFGEPEQLAADLTGTKEAVEMLLELAGEFSDRYQEKKRDRNLVDFNDLEHQALKVLIRWEGDQMSYTEVADELSGQYEEVLVDEYQDSNLVQEALLHAVSKERFGHPNVFMVGDVKQSIYRFRLARPELFLEKYDSYDPYGTAESGAQKIELHQNFRSREGVLCGTNDLFYRIMTKNLGNIRYTDEAALYPGAKFAPAEGRTGGLPELLAADTGDASLQQMDEEAADFTAREIEARMIASKIREMIDQENGLLVWDKKLGGYRIAQLRDMAILLRSTSGWTETFLAVLMNEGIPAYAESRMGYFTTVEVETILSLLAVVDNPIQDIPLAAVLKSPIGGLSDQELSQVMAHYRRCPDKGQDRGIYGAMCRYEMDFGGDNGVAQAGGLSETGAAAGEGDGVSSGAAGADRAARETARKLSRFQTLRKQLRLESTYRPIHELLYRAYELTGYYDYAAAMPAGETRKANLDMLVEKAAAYERTSYKGLFHFIRYIENLKKYNTDFGEASTVGEEDNTVRIMSIHKSKGLEFPVVFLAGMGKKFNKQDVYGKVLIDPELGIGTDYLDLDLRLKTSTIKKNVLKRKMEMDSLGEELRVLYVAMTRAKEQLIMTGTDRSLSKKLEKFARVPVADGQIPGTVLATASSYLDWVLMGIGAGCRQITMTEILVEDVVGTELARQINLRQSKNLLLSDDWEESDSQIRKLLDQRLNFQYPFEADLRLHTKMTVSELKKLGQMIDEAESVGPEELFETTEAEWEEPNQEEPGQTEPNQEEPRQTERASAPAFTPGGGFGATRGTAYHRVLELLDFSRIDSQAQLRQSLDQLCEKKRILTAARRMVKSQVLWNFLKSSLGQRMKQAADRGQLYRERQFVMGVPARILEAGDSDELIVIQGIIDAYLEEDGQLVVIDYKTDRVRDGQELIGRYGLQLYYYRLALEQMTGKTVKEMVIYSLSLQQEIPVPIGG